MFENVSARHIPDTQYSFRGVTPILKLSKCVLRCVRCPYVTGCPSQIRFAAPGSVFGLAASVLPRNCHIFNFVRILFFSFLRIDLLKRFFIKRRTNVHTTLQHYDLVLTNWHFWELSSNRQTRKTKCTKDLLVQRDMSPFPTFSIYLLITICVSTGNANSLRCFVVVIIHCFYAWSIFNIVLSWKSCIFPHLLRIHNLYEWSSNKFHTRWFIDWQLPFKRFYVRSFA